MSIKSKLFFVIIYKRHELFTKIVHELGVLLVLFFLLVFDRTQELVQDRFVRIWIDPFP